MRRITAAAALAATLAAGAIGATLATTSEATVTANGPIGCCRG